MRTNRHFVDKPSFTCLLYALSEQAYDRDNFSRFVSRRTRNDDPRVVAPPALPRLCACAANSAAIEESITGGRGVALSGAPETAESKAGEGAVGCLPYQPAGENLQHYDFRFAPAGRADFQFRTNV